MCFGGDKKTEETTKTTTIDPALAAASRSNISQLSNLANAGYKTYEGQRVADPNAQQTSAYSMINSLAGTTDPYKLPTETAFLDAAQSPNSVLRTTRAIDNVPGEGASGSTQDYMDPYLDAVLEPQLYDLNKNSALQQNQLDARATMGGAFGDARSGFEASANSDALNRLRAATIGNAKSQAFDRAMALKTGDINRLLDVGKSNAALNEQGLARRMAGGQQLTALDQYLTGRTADLAALQDKAGAEQQANAQAKLDAAYQEYTKGNMDAQTLWQLVNQAINGSPLQKQGTTDAITKKPDNSGFGLIGSLAGGALGSMLGPVGTSVGAKLGDMASDYLQDMND